ncbi:Hypothetical protein AA314_06621 [Archangium gephyra]|uniref:Uncharacterized protein n=1 Tax=Archangium gephyra TaxID=48 RepID=A0AAC8TGN3_9BACT|nr:Hypothetical protein AA314_06621 [Archangium gephyra]
MRAGGTKETDRRGTSVSPTGPEASRSGGVAHPAGRAPVPGAGRRRRPRTPGAGAGRARAAPPPGGARHFRSRACDRRACGAAPRACPWGRASAVGARRAGRGRRRGPLPHVHRRRGAPARTPGRTRPPTGRASRDRGGPPSSTQPGAPHRGGTITSARSLAPAG